ncbi:MAG TPA: FtsX-like permease family protein [Gaiellaceae bacterium]|nr:FtsX-like permease family protein [Gaiellaceae bacterium]
MIRVALRGLAGRKLRATLTALAIILGVAMMSGTFVLTDTIDKAFSQIFDDAYEGTDVVVSGRGAEISFQGTRSEAPPIDEALVDDVQGVPGVELAAGGVYDETNTKIIGSDGKSINTQGAPSMGFGIDVRPEYDRFNPLDLVAGRWSEGEGEVVIDAGTADREGFAVGDTVRIATLQPARDFELVGIAQFGDVSSLGTSTVAVFDLATAQALLDREGQVDEISVAGREGTTPEQLIAEIEPILPADAQVRSAQAEADDEKEEIGEFTSFIRYFLLAFAGIALFVGAFVIFNTLSITVAQRTREFATLRTVGASRRQVLRTVIVEALAIGVAASVVGLFAGFGLAIGLNELFKALELELPTADMVFATRTIVVSLLVGTLITLAAGLFPAIRATRVPPIAAVREGYTLPRSRFARFTPWIALVAIGLSLLLLGYSMFRDEVSTGTRLLAIAGGVLLLFLGVAMISSHLVRPLAAVLGLPARQIGGAAGKLARGNSVRNPGRTAATAAALMIGIALVTFVAVLANGMKASNREAIEEQVVADYVVTSQDGYSPFVAAAGDSVAGSSEAETVSSVRSDLGQVGDAATYVTGIDPETILATYSFEWKEGSDELAASIAGNAAILDSKFAEDNSIAVSDTIPLLTASGETLDVEVTGLYEPPPFYPLLGGVSIAQETFDSVYERPRNQFTFVNVAGDPSDGTTEALTAAAADYPDALVQTRGAWIDKQDADFNQFLTMLYVLLALSVIVSLFGMVNTLVLSVFERTRELGMLRAVGMTRRQARRMIRHESVITALIGAALGLPLGVFLAVLVTRALEQFDVRFAVPWGQLVVFAAIAVLVGIFAAIMPARRAAKLNVLRALQYE